MLGLTPGFFKHIFNYPLSLYEPGPGERNSYLTNTGARRHPPYNYQNMGAFSLGFQHDLQRESWALYALGIVVIALRMFVPHIHSAWTNAYCFDLGMLELGSLVFGIWNLMTT